MADRSDMSKDETAPETADAAEEGESSTEKDSENAGPTDRVYWHNEFSSLETADIYSQNREGYGQDYVVETGYEVMKEPGKIDMLVQRTNDQFAFKGPMYEGFRKWNVLEFKSADDGLNEGAWHQAVMYASSLCVHKDVRGEDVTITLACPRYPRKLVRQLTNAGNKFEEVEGHPGIFRGQCYPFAMVQIVVTGRLSTRDHKWLRQVQRSMSREELGNLASELKKIEDFEVRRMAGEALVKAFKRTVARAKSEEDRMALIDVMARELGPEMDRYMDRRFEPTRQMYEQQVQAAEARAEKAETEAAQAKSEAAQVEADSQRRIQQAEEKLIDMVQKMRDMGLDPDVIRDITGES